MATATSTASGAVSGGEVDVSTDAEVGSSSSSSFSSCSDSDDGDAGDDIDFLFAELMAEDIPEAVAAAAAAAVEATTTADQELLLYLGGGDGGHAPVSAVTDMGCVRAI
ncbi:hypothetical protein Esi_0145_0006 [Ectocarpus siliculosus]|uniref:Uncharacterized protein n=1 Tax=Ectocarpus siliculosus TaxID=2880 RepID=D8LF85_ECTSI|nr:hypothetical protein Esi_0145_0006 [Ectocarpus siliculosus]|eukprot:CBN78810.1 hypothetical protein Esi_0145_0006 [Ectocarpus siliculosus]